MEVLPPIPVPPGKRWTEFKTRFLPLIVFAILVLMAANLWRHNVVTPTMLGQVESVSAAVVSPESGIITSLLVKRYQSVKAGDPVAEITSNDPRSVDLRLAFLRTKLSLITTEVGTSMDQDRMGFNFENMRLAYERLMIEKAVTQAELKVAEQVLERLSKGRADRVVSIIDYETGLRVRDGLKARLEESEKLLAKEKEKLDGASHFADSLNAPRPTNSPSMRLLDELAAEREQLLKASDGKIILRAPITGQVNVILRQAGQQVLAGDSLFTITANESRQIIGYMHPPVPFDPQPGMKVQVRRRSNAREQGMTQIAAVGPQMEPVLQPLLRPGVTFEIGVPISINIPEGLRLMPGELVELTLSTGKN